MQTTFDQFIEENAHLTLEIRRSMFLLRELDIKIESTLV